MVSLEINNTFLVVGRIFIAKIIIPDTLDIHGLAYLPSSRFMTTINIEEILGVKYQKINTLNWLS
jgi:hypothetical protein